jgi:chromosome segregation ATPase
MNKRHNYGVVYGLIIAMGITLASHTAYSQDDDKRANREREALRRMQQMQRSLQAEKGALEQEKAALEQSKAALEAEKSNLASQNKKLSGENNALKSSYKSAFDKTKRAYEKDRKQLIDLVRERNEQIKTMGDDVASARSKVVALEEQIAQGIQQVNQLQAEREQMTKALEATKLALTESRGREQETLTRAAQIKNEKATVEAQMKGTQKELLTCEDKNAKLYRYNRDILGVAQNQSLWQRLSRAEPFTQLKKVEIENLLEEYRDKIDAQEVLKAQPKK